METWIAFGQGPLFRLSFALMLLGLGRVMYTGMAEGFIAGSSPGSKTADYPGPLKALFQHIGKVMQTWTKEPLLNLTGLIFHIGYILVPLFLAAHVVQWKRGIGFGWWSLPQNYSDVLTMAVMITAPLLFVLRLANVISRGDRVGMRMFWPLLLFIPFFTGYLCVNGNVTPKAYHNLLFMHVYSGNLLLLAIPFTRVAECILVPIGKIFGSIGYRLGQFWIHKARPFLGEEGAQ